MKVTPKTHAFAENLGMEVLSENWPLPEGETPCVSIGEEDMDEPDALYQIREGGLFLVWQITNENQRDGLPHWIPSQQVLRNVIEHLSTNR